MHVDVSCVMTQAAQVRKVAFVPDEGADYQPDRHSGSTIYAGTTVQQVSQ